MGELLDYKDSIQIVKTMLGTDGYATQGIDEIADVNALFIVNTGWQHGNHQTAVISDAEVYLDPENDFVLDNFERLEGMLIIANPLGDAENQAWYRITSVIVGQDKLLGNEIDNVNCQLKKTKRIEYVS